MAGVQEFAKKLAEDADFAKQFEGVQSTEELLAKIKAAGYEVTQEALKSLAGAEGEISEDELDNITGGVVLTMRTLVARSQSKGIKTIPSTSTTGGVVHAIADTTKTQTGAKNVANRIRSKIVSC
jgi:predicted ribosomally synthesized peptide with nif11-like leader